MQIERNLSIPLRSLIERVVEAKDEFASTQVLVDKDKRQQQQQQQEDLQNEPEEKQPETFSVTSLHKLETVDKPVLARKLDLLA
jgi:hypothetical protein